MDQLETNARQDFWHKAESMFGPIGNMKKDLLATLKQQCDAEVLLAKAKRSTESFHKLKMRKWRRDHQCGNSEVLNKLVAHNSKNSLDKTEN